MKRILSLVLLLIAARVAAQEQLPLGHVHSYTGQAMVMTLPDGRIAIALATVASESDPLVDHLFVFQPEARSKWLYAAIPKAEVRFFHDHLVLISDSDRQVFSLRPEPQRERGDRWGIYGGIGLAHYYDIPALGLNETELSAYLAAELADRRGIAPDSFDPHNQKPPGGGGGGGGGTNCPAACSYTCQHGVAQASCSPSPPWCALCNCRLDGSPIAYCYQS